MCRLNATIKSFLSIWLYRFEALLCRMSRLQTAVLSSARGHVSMSQWTLYHHYGQAWTLRQARWLDFHTSIIIPRSHVLWLIFRCSQLSSLCPLTLAVTEQIFSLLTVFIRILVSAWLWSHACIKTFNGCKDWKVISLRFTSSRGSNNNIFLIFVKLELRKYLWIFQKRLW